MRSWASTTRSHLVQARDNKVWRLSPGAVCAGAQSWRKAQSCGDTDTIVMLRNDENHRTFRICRIPCIPQLNARPGDPP